MKRTLTVDEVQALPVMVDVVTAGRALGIGRTTAYELVRQGRFPCRVVRIGGCYRVPAAELRQLLGLDRHPHGSTPSVPLALRDAAEGRSDRSPADFLRSPSAPRGRGEPEGR